MNCPNCDSTNIENCGRQFVENPSGHYRINDETRRLVDRLLLERLSLAGIPRAAQVCESWLQKYFNEKCADTPQEVDSSFVDLNFSAFS
jgi:hypothetical protein